MLFEKLHTTRLQAIVQDKNILPDHQFGIRADHSAIQQVHRLSATIRQALEEGKYCPGLFHDIKQSFVKV